MLSYGISGGKPCNKKGLCKQAFSYSYGSFKSDILVLLLLQRVMLGGIVYGASAQKALCLFDLRGSGIGHFYRL